MKWRIYEMLTGNHDINRAVLNKAKKKDLIEAIIEYIKTRGK